MIGLRSTLEGVPQSAENLDGNLHITFFGFLIHG